MKGGLQRYKGKVLQMTNMLNVLMLLVLSWLYVFVKMYPIVCFRRNPEEASGGGAPVQTWGGRAPFPCRRARSAPAAAASPPRPRRNGRASTEAGGRASPRCRAARTGRPD